MNDKFYKVFTAGKYPQGSITVDDLRELVNNYDPDYFEAPLTLDHADTGPVYGAVNKVMLQGKDLLCSFTGLTDDMLELNRQGKYKKPSVEITEYENKGVYLRAVSLVPFPAVKNLPAIQFAESNSTFYFNEAITLNFNKPFLEDNMDVKTFAEKIGINIADFSSDQDILDNALSIVTQLKADMAAQTEKIQSLNISLAKYSEMEASVADLKKERNELLLSDAVAAGKISTAQAQELKAFAETDFESCKKFIDSTTVLKAKPERNPELFKQVIKPVIPEVGNKFYDDNGKKITYRDILTNPTLANKFSETEIENMRQESELFN